MSHVSEETTTVQPTLHHFNLKTSRLHEMIEWYGTVVGMTSNYTFPGGAWLTNDEANHRLALLVSPALSDDPDKLMHNGFHHSAFEYPSMGALLDTYSRLKTLGSISFILKLANPIFPPPRTSSKLRNALSTKDGRTMVHRRDCPSCARQSLAISAKRET